MESRLTQAQICEWVSRGKSRKEVIELLENEGMTYTSAEKLYYTALKDLAPEPNLFDDYKKGIIQQNLNRLEKIVSDCIEGNVGEKTVALRAIDTLNKMLGVYNENNSVTIAKNNKGEEIIQITFDK